MSDDHTTTSNLFTSTLTAFRNILSLPQKKRAALTICLILCTSILDVFSLASVMPLILLVLDSSMIQTNVYLKSIYDFFGFENNIAFIYAVVATMVILFAAKNLAAIGITHFQSRFIYGVASDLSEKALSSYFSKDFSYYANTNTSVPARNTLEVPVQFSVNVLLASITFTSETIVFVLILAGIAIYDLSVFALLFLILGPPFFLVYRIKKDRLTAIGEVSDKLRPLSMKHLYQGLNSYIECKLYSKEGFFIRQFTDLHDRLHRNFARFYTYSLLPARLIEVIAVIGIAAILVYSLLFHDNRNATILLLSLFTAAAYRIMPSLNRIFIAVMNIKTFQWTIPIMVSHNTASAIDVPKHSDDGELRFEDQVRFHEVEFTYPESNQPTLQKLSFALNKGETIGLIGSSGAGKTTTINLFLRFLQEQSGSVFVDDIALDHHNVSAWRKFIGYVRQDPLILDASIAENVAFGESQIDETEIINTLKLAGLESLIDSLPEGIHTQIGEQGAKLSGGQRQRITIARALYRKAEILIFDEATSELDADTERQIVESISGLREKTILIVAHRLSTLKSCDRVLELEDGKVVRETTYTELVGGRS